MQHTCTRLRLSVVRCHVASHDHIHALAAKMFAVANPVVLSRPQARRAPVAQRGAALSVRAQGKVCCVPPPWCAQGPLAPSTRALGSPRMRHRAARVA